MPSIDGVGRYFPLTLIAHDDAPSGKRAGLPPPEADPQEAWFQRAESFLIDALDEGRAYEDTLRNLAAMPLPEARKAEGKVDGQVAVLSNVDPGLMQSAFAQLRECDTACFHSGMTFWWTAGGEDYPGIAAAQSGMPDPYFLAGVLTGRFTAESKIG
jgi:type VI secretion system protein ImpM